MSAPVLFDAAAPEISKAEDEQKNDGKNRNGELGNSTGLHALSPKITDISGYLQG